MHERLLTNHAFEERTELIGFDIPAPFERKRKSMQQKEPFKRAVEEPPKGHRKVVILPFW